MFRFIDIKCVVKYFRGEINGTSQDVQRACIFVWIFFRFMVFRVIIQYKYDLCASAIGINYAKLYNIIINCKDVV